MTRRLAFRLVSILALGAFAATPSSADERPAGAAPATAADRAAAWERHQALYSGQLFGGLEWRSIGPIVQGGRVVDVESVPGEPYSFYVAYASGGLWKTTNNGTTFEPLTDGLPTIVAGDVAVDPRDPKRVWLGSGENNSSRSSYGGMGVFLSEDAGKSWRSVGLADSDRIGRIVVDPRDGRRVYVAALGKLYTPGGERGVYRTTDGGASWQQVLPGDDWTGAIDLALDPSNPDVVYAATWERRRRPWDFVEGGPGSAIWKSTDAGSTWTRLAGGFPAGADVGRIGLAVAASRPSTLYAALDNQELLPEEEWDLGDAAITAQRLRKMTKEEFLAFDADTIEDFIRANDLDSELDAKKLIEKVKKDEVTLEDLLEELEDANADLFRTDIRGLEVWRSDDAGATWSRTHTLPIREVVYTYGYYFGQIRVSPSDPERIYCVGVPAITSGDGGKTFTSISDPDVHVDYHAVWVDPAFPDRVVAGNDGGLDVSYDGGASWVGLDAQPVGQFYALAVDMADPYRVYGGLQDNGTLAGSSRAEPDDPDAWQYVGGGDGMVPQVDPRDNRTVYAGFQFGFYARTDPDGKRAQVRPRDALGDPALRYNWMTPILLSSHNADILYFGANRLYRSLDQGTSWTAISPDLTRSENRGNVPFATITTIAESPIELGLLWAGTDDGLVHVSEDGGVQWREATAGLVAERWVSRVEASPHERATAYVSLNGYRDDDPTPYLYKTTDLGATWTSIAAGLPAEAINVVREDPVKAGLLYVGTDKGVYASLDGGATWQGLGSGLPPVAVHDLVVHPRERELVAGTHGRSIWILDVLPVQEAVEAKLREEKVHVFPVEPETYDRGWQGRINPWFYRPDDDPELEIPFWTAAAGQAVLEVRDADARVLRRIERDAAAGVGTFAWDLKLDPVLALAAEKARVAKEDADEAKKAKEAKKGKKAAKDEPADPKLGQRGRTPWAEAIRLGWPLYATPGTYTLAVVAGGAEHTTDFEMEKPSPREPRAKVKMKIRGEKKDG